MTKDQRERALEALERLQGFVDLFKGGLTPNSNKRPDEALATIRAALEPSAVDQVLDGREFDMYSNGDGDFTVRLFDPFAVGVALDAESAARKALEEVER